MTRKRRPVSWRHWLLLLFAYAIAGEVWAQTYADADCGKPISAPEAAPSRSNASDAGTHNDCGDKPAAPSHPYPTTSSDGDPFQCVELVRRYYRLALGINTSSWPRPMNAKSFFTRYVELDLARFPNGDASPPQQGDVIVFDAVPSNSAGHVAIVTGVAGDRVQIIEQNWNRYSGSAELRRRAASSGWDLYRVLNNGAESAYKVLGWLGKRTSVPPSPFIDVNYPSATATTLFDINNSGTVVGIATFGNKSIGFSYSNGNFNPLPYPFGSNNFNGFTATGITDSGIVLGNYDTGRVDASGLPIGAGYLFNSGTYTSFSLAGATSTGIRGVSSDGRYLAGLVYFATGARQYVHDRQTNTTKFVGSGNEQASVLQGVNAAGKAVGSWAVRQTDGSLLQEGFIFDFASGSITRLSAAGFPDREMRPRAIDNLGKVAGFVTGTSGTKAFYGWPGTVKTFEYPGAIATSLNGNNDAGRLVGQAIMPSGEVRGFLLSGP